MEKYESMQRGGGIPLREYSTCVVCMQNKEIRAEVQKDGNDVALCSDPCINAYRFTNKIQLGK